MGKGIYIGNASSKACKVRKIYVGDSNGKSRKVKKIYIGDSYSKARLGYMGTIPAGEVVFTTSQMWAVPDGVSIVDVFLVGGGASGNALSRTSTNEYNSGGIGGSSGFTVTYQKVTVTPNSKISVVVGAGGAASAYNVYGKAGGVSLFGSYTANGCAGGAPLNTVESAWPTSWTGQGMHKGGAGGGAYGYTVSSSNLWRASDGGVDGGNGNGDTRWAGVGQGSTTRAFGESSNTLYAGGGGGGASHSLGGIGGLGGGGNGGTSTVVATSGTPNTGGGGGGGRGLIGNTDYSGAGGSGIVIVRWAEQ